MLKVEAIAIHRGKTVFLYESYRQCLMPIVAFGKSLKMILL